MRNYLHHAHLFASDHPGQKQFRFSTSLFPSSRQNHGHPSRPDHHSSGILRSERLSRKIATDSLLRCAEQQTVRVFNQQFFTASFDDYRTLSLPLADRIIFQMDQAAPSDKSLLWDFGKCGEDPNLDCHFGLCACCHR